MKNRCRLCNREVFQAVKTKQSNCDMADWFLCLCGAITTNYEPSSTPFTEEYAQKITELKSIDERYDYLVRVYAPFIEENVYGRKMLDVGFGVPTIINKMTDRGWVCDGIDVIPNKFTTGDFETFDFVNNNKDRYDLIWMGDVLQCFKNPLSALIKAYNLLNPHGILFISTPNSDLVKDGTMPMFGHWNAMENNILINPTILKDMLSRVDESFTGRMNILLSNERVISRRFVSSNSMHFIAQKQKIEDCIIPCEMLDETKVSS